MVPSLQISNSPSCKIDQVSEDAVSSSNYETTMLAGTETDPTYKEESS